MDMLKRLELIIKGRVQGVFFRHSTREHAQDLGVVGWVANCPDGSVKIVAEGEERVLKKLYDWCCQGPPLAHVDEVEEEWEEILQKLFASFEIRG